MLLGALGDVHGAFADARRIVERHREVPAWLCVGDIASEAGGYESLGGLIYWIHGNNDGSDAIAAGAISLPGCSTSARTARLRSTSTGLRVAGLGGTFAPTWVDRRRPAPCRTRRKRAPRSATAPEADRRRHFVRRRGGRLQGVAIHRRFSHARSVEAVSPASGWAGTGRGKGTDQRGASSDAAQAAPVRAPSSVFRAAARERPVGRTRSREPLVSAD